MLVFACACVRSKAWRAARMPLGLARIVHPARHSCRLHAVLVAAPALFSHGFGPCHLDIESAVLVPVWLSQRVWAIYIIPLSSLSAVHLFYSNALCRAKACKRSQPSRRSRLSLTSRVCSRHSRCTSSAIAAQTGQQPRVSMRCVLSSTQLEAQSARQTHSIQHAASLAWQRRIRHL